MTSVAGVNVVHWNPRRYRLPFARSTRVGPRVNNFGDLLGPEIVRRLAPQDARPSRTSLKRLVAVGSILHLSQDGDVVWGAGVNGKVEPREFSAARLDVRAVRGPMTRDWLFATRRIESPEIYGDPGLLIPRLFPELASVSSKRREMCVIPNLNERERYSAHPAYISPRSDWRLMLRSIAESDYVVGSSLHAIILADALGVPNALIRSVAESPFKYRDYYEGTGRREYFSATGVEDAVKHARSLARNSFDPLAEWDADRLLKAFPSDLWR